MKFLRIILLIVSLYFLPNSLVAQWYRLPNPETYLLERMHCPYLYVPKSIVYPAANNVVLFDVFCQEGSIGDYNIMESQNDLSLDTDKYDQHGTSCCYYDALCSINDSTHAFLLSNGEDLLYYTSNNFSTITNLNTSFTSFYGGVLAMTKRFIYVAILPPYDPLQNLIFNEINISSNTYNYSESTVDSGTGKLFFINDSTGFILTYHRSNPTTNTLIKTSNYAVTWNDIFYDPLNNITDYCFPTKDTGYVIKSKALPMDSGQELTLPWIRI